VPEPRKRPRSSWIRFEAAAPNEVWQSDLTHWHLADGTEVEIICWLDDHSRYLLACAAFRRVAGDDVVATFTAAGDAHGVPTLSGTSGSAAPISAVSHGGIGRSERAGRGDYFFRCPTLRHDALVLGAEFAFGADHQLARVADVRAGEGPGDPAGRRRNDRRSAGRLWSGRITKGVRFVAETFSKCNVGDGCGPKGDLREYHIDPERPSRG